MPTPEYTPHIFTKFNVNSILLDMSKPEVTATRKNSLEDDPRKKP